MGEDGEDLGGIDFSGFDNLDITDLLKSGSNNIDYSQVAGDYGSDLSSELDKLLKSTGKASSLFSDDGGFSMDALFRSMKFDDDTEPGSSGGTQGSYGPALLAFNDDTEPGSSGGFEGSYGSAGEGDLGFYNGSSYTGSGEKLVFDDDREPGSSGGTQGSYGPGLLAFTDDTEPGSSGGSSGSTGVAGSGDLGSYKGSTYDNSGGKRTTIDDNGNVILPDGTKVTPGGTVIPPGGKGGGGGAGTPAKKDNNMLMMLLALMALMSQNKGGSSGSTATIPSLTADRKQLPYGQASGSTARPGAGGVQYFTPTTYSTKAAGGGMMYGGGGISDLGGYSDGGRLLKGPGDGVSDSIPATIGGKQPARLAEGEFVVPARIVSELGNGSTQAGAQRLYGMMDRVQSARRKTKNVAADTKAHKYLPA